ncbi:hypothetical protein NL676_020006 [Syzygium grande]|nr:hypothetical protein NL676_020006 [Syzygium grande]
MSSLTLPPPSVVCRCCDRPLPACDGGRLPAIVVVLEPFHGEGYVVVLFLVRVEEAVVLLRRGAGLLVLVEEGEKVDREVGLQPQA